MYAIYLIASKNVKLFFKNVVLLPMLIGIPLFQIYMMNSMLSTEPVLGEFVEGFVKLTILQGTSNGGSFIDFFAASTLVQFVFIAAVVLNANLVTERQENTYTRMLASPLKKWRIIAGNLIGNTLVCIIVAAFIIITTYLLFNMSWGESIPKLILITILTALASTSVSYFIASFFKDAKVAGGAMSMIMILMTFLSGGFSGEGTLQTIRLFTYNKWAVDGYLAVLRSQEAGVFLPNLVALITILIVTFTASTIIYERRDLNG